jgi:hypothetical protein
LASHPLNKSSTIPETFATSSGVAYWHNAAVMRVPRKTPSDH